MTPLLTQLKSQTQAEHTQLETRLDLFCRVQDLPAYRQVVAGFLGIYEPLEENLVQSMDWMAAGWPMPAERKTPWLLEDLRAMGVDAGSAARLPRCPNPPVPRTMAAAVGCLYVLEGSTLGGKVISRQFAQTLGIHPGNGGRFFAGYGEDTVPHWRLFGAWVQSVEATLDPEQAVNAAKETFQRFDEWLNSPAPAQSFAP
jgi:heme oxygenase